MKIISWNVNGIRAVIRKGFTKFLDQENPDIICLQEIKANKDQVEIDFDNYEEVWNSAEKKGYSGTAILSKNKPMKTIYDIPNHLELFDTQKRNGMSEGRVLTAEYKDFFLTTVYTPNSKRDLSRLDYRYDKWDPTFLEYIKELDKKKPVIFCGDLNVAHKEIDLARPKQNEGEHGFTKEEREGFDNIVKAGFVDTFRMFNQDGDNYTWWTHWGKARERNVGWRIDYFLVSERIKENVKNAFIMPEVHGSDHCPVGIEIEFK